MKIIVTGGCGFIGSCLIKYLLTIPNMQVINIDKLTYSSNLLSLKNFVNKKNYVFKKFDIVNTAKVLAVLKEFKPNGIINLAAETHVDRSIDNPGVFLKSNILGTHSLLEATRIYLNKIKNKNFKFVHISTDEVYGELKRKQKKFSEQSNYCPKSPYSASKASSDHLVLSWFHTYKVPTIITNCGNNFGPSQHPEKLIPHTILSALNNKKITVYGNGQNIRDWIYVQDHVESIYQIFKKGIVGEKYNIGANNELANIDVVKFICNILDKIKPLKKESYKNLIAYVSDRPGHDLRYALNTSKINNTISWKSKYKFSESLLSTVIWYIAEFPKWKKGLKKKYQLTRIGTIKS